MNNEKITQEQVMQVLCYTECKFFGIINIIFFRDYHVPINRTVFFCEELQILHSDWKALRNQSTEKTNFSSGVYYN